MPTAFHKSAQTSQSAELETSAMTWHSTVGTSVVMSSWRDAEPCAFERPPFIYAATRTIVRSLASLRDRTCRVFLRGAAELLERGVEDVLAGGGVGVQVLQLRIT
jgi:hypothetical protein